MTGALDILAVATLPYTSAGATSFQFGGSMFYAALLTALGRRGHRVRVLAEAPRADGRAERRDLEWNVPGFEVHGFASEYRSAATPPSADEQARARRALAPWFERLVAQARPDVVLLGREHLAWYALDLCLEHRLPSVLAVHGVPTHGLHDGVYPEAARGDLLRRFQNADARITVATHLAEVLRGFGIDSVTIPNAIDVDRFRPRPKSARLLAELGIDAADPVVGHVSSLKPGKRPMDVVASAAQVLRAARGVYVIVGDGPGRGEMEATVRARGIDDRFRFVPTVDFRQMPELLALCDVVVMPSEREGSSLVYLETQAAGRVLIASDIPAAREAIVDGETGLLFRLADVDALAAKTIAMLRDPAERRRIGAAAGAGAERRPLEGLVDAYENVLREVVARQR